ncbi:hypothetical protein SERLA73DRAFT_69811 [Serpula lacrymans var. lacrymans S7.3]|uniref:F-box domain-containing protein n=1 Tax=Serpula lacrymans var. lacrymans (strain S7.3) TaxID=936435 RepID=F8PLB0_SERL3|nr:hypothetical protein SERLA73DRAFT_69811 [Serpula lacrymans var. lacrymans S7.3]
MDLLPMDVLRNIVKFFPEIDLLSFRQVSKCCQEAASDKSLWKHTYKNASLPRPPGPYLNQQPELLISRLTSSAKVAANWAPRVANAVSQRYVATTDHRGADRYTALLFGRWFMITCAEGIMCYDLDKTPDVHYIVYQSTSPIRRIVCPTTFGKVGEHVAFAVIKQSLPGMSLIKIFRIDITLPRVCFVPFAEFTRGVHDDLAFATLGQQLLAVGDRRRSQYSMVIDVETSSLFQLPPISSQLKPGIAPSLQLASKEYIATSAHLLVIYTTSDTLTPYSFIQVFDRPSLTDTLLELTYEGICQTALFDCELLYESSTETGDTRLAIIGIDREPSRFNFIIAQLTLSPTTMGSGVQIACHRIFSLEGNPIYASTFSSQNGYARGLCYSYGFHGPCSIGYTISPDSSGGYHCDVQTVHFLGYSYGAVTSYPPLFFEGYTGRVCYRSATKSKSYILEVLDFALPDLFTNDCAPAIL